jgi:hypothetical protein
MTVRVEYLRQSCHAWVWTGRWGRATTALSYQTDQTRTVVRPLGLAQKAHLMLHQNGPSSPCKQTDGRTGQRDRDWDVVVHQEGNRQTGPASLSALSLAPLPVCLVYRSGCPPAQSCGFLSCLIKLLFFHPFLVLQTNTLFSGTKSFVTFAPNPPLLINNHKDFFFPNIVKQQINTFAVTTTNRSR